MSPSLKAKVELELKQLDQLRESCGAALQRAASGERDEETIVVLASALHSLYNGAENALKRILLETDGSLPAGDRSHSELLEQAARATDYRRAVISSDLHESLRPLMAFRHFFRHAYTFQFRWDKLEAHILDFDKILRTLRSELMAFLEG